MSYEIKNAFIWGLGWSVGIFFLSAVISSQNPLDLMDTPDSFGQTEVEAVPPTYQPPQSDFYEEVLWEETPVPIAAWDEGVSLELLRGDGGVEEITLKDYLWGVVAAEMPGSFPLEALKAQAVAARTYTMLRLEQSMGKHGEGRLCDDSNCCQAYVDLEVRLESWGGDAPLYQAKIQQAVADTEGLFVLYEGNVIDAVFFSSASGQTLDAQMVWGASLPYLKSVSSPEGDSVPNYQSTVVISQEELRILLQSYYPSVNLPEEGAEWFLDLVEVTGAVAQYTVGGVVLTGGQLRSLLGLRSTSFQVDYFQEEREFVFSVVGYGHGVGLSQYGAKAMAEEGAKFQDILTWYYSDCTVEGYGKTL